VVLKFVVPDAILELLLEQRQRSTPGVRRLRHRDLEPVVELVGILVVEEPQFGKQLTAFVND
jgi:hypothetical protein